MVTIIFTMRRKAGARALVVERFSEKLPGLTQIRVPDSRDAMGRLSAVFLW